MFRVGDWVQVGEQGHTYFGRLYTGEAKAGSVAEITRVNDNGTYCVLWQWHPDGFEGQNDHLNDGLDPTHHSQADESCLLPYQPLDVTSIEEVEKWLTT